MVTGILLAQNIPRVKYLCAVGLLNLFTGQLVGMSAQWCEWAEPPYKGSSFRQVCEFQKTCNRRELVFKAIKVHTADYHDGLRLLNDFRTRRYPGQLRSVTSHFGAVGTAGSLCNSAAFRQFPTLHAAEFKNNSAPQRSAWKWKNHSCEGRGFSFILIPAPTYSLRALRADCKSKIQDSGLRPIVLVERSHFRPIITPEKRKGPAAEATGPFHRRRNES